MSDIESEYVAANIRPLMRLSSVQSERLENAVRTDFKPPYESVDNFLDSLGEAWLSSDLMFDSTVEQFAQGVQQALVLLWTKNDFVKGEGREPSPKSQDQFAELIDGFVSTELTRGTPEAALPGGMPAADTTAGPSGMELDSTAPADTDLTQATGAVKASTQATPAHPAAAAVPHSKLSDSAVENAGHNDSAQEMLLKLVVNSDVPRAAKMAMSATILAPYHARTPAVSSFRSGSRSSPPEPFHGRADDHGQIAQSWLYGIELYFEAEVTPNPVAKAVTYLQNDARYWWQQTGSGAMPPAPTFHDFKTAFLARFVKPSDSAKARSEIPTLEHTSSVEAFASHFRTVNSRITVGSPIDTTTLANFFVRGLKEKLAKALAAHCSLSIMQELDPLISAAEEMEAKLNLASKQEQPSLAALQHADERNTPQRGGHGPARRPGRRGGRGPYPNNRGGGRQSTRGYSGRGSGGRGRGNSSHNTAPYSQFASKRHCTAGHQKLAACTTNKGRGVARPVMAPTRVLPW